MQMTEKYYTIFLASYGWSEDPKPLLLFIHWIIERVSLMRNAQVVFTNRSGVIEKPRALTEKVLAECETRILNRNLQKMGLTVKNRWDSLVFSVYFHNLWFEYLPDYMIFLDPDIPLKTECITALKFLSISIDKHIYEDVFGNEESRYELQMKINKLFVDMNCVYGNINKTRFPISNPFNLLKYQNESSSRQRFIDFDYANHIENVYEYNLLSGKHLLSLGDIERLFEDNYSVEVKKIFDNSLKLYGASIYLRSGSFVDIFKIREKLRPVLAGFGESKTLQGYLLINKLQLDRLGDIKNIKLRYPSKEIKVLPYDYIRIRQPDILTIEDAQRHTENLRKLYELIIPGSGKGNRYVHEYIEDYSGLFERESLYYRLPSLDLRPTDFVKVRFTDRINRDCLKINLILMSSHLKGIKNKITSLVKNWISQIESNSDVYGIIKLLKGEEYIRVKKGEVLQVVINAEGLNQEAINLLIVMLDEVNVEKCVIPYLVFGDIEFGDKKLAYNKDGNRNRKTAITCE